MKEGNCYLIISYALQWLRSLPSGHLPLSSRWPAVHGESVALVWLTLGCIRCSGADATCGSDAPPERLGTRCHPSPNAWRAPSARFFPCGEIQKRLFRHQQAFTRSVGVHDTWVIWYTKFKKPTCLLWSNQVVIWCDTCWCICFQRDSKWLGCQEHSGHNTPSSDLMSDSSLDKLLTS